MAAGHTIRAGCLFPIFSLKSQLYIHHSSAEGKCVTCYPLTLIKVSMKWQEKLLERKTTHECGIWRDEFKKRGKKAEKQRFKSENFAGVCYESFRDITMIWHVWLTCLMSACPHRVCHNSSKLGCSQTHIWKLCSQMWLFVCRRVTVTADWCCCTEVKLCHRHPLPGDTTW